MIDNFLDFFIVSVFDKPYCNLIGQEVFSVFAEIQLTITSKVKPQSGFSTSSKGWPSQVCHPQELAVSDRSCKV